MREKVAKVPRGDSGRLLCQVKKGRLSPADSA